MIESKESNCSGSVFDFKMSSLVFGGFGVNLVATTMFLYGPRKEEK